MTINNNDCQRILKKLSEDSISSSMQISVTMIDCAEKLFDYNNTYQLIYDIVKNQSSMAAVINTGLKIMKAIKQKDRNALSAIKKELTELSDFAINRAASFLQGTKNIVTISFSQSVFKLIKIIKPKSVHLSVSHPAKEGEKLAGLLMEQNIKPVLFEDSAYSIAMKYADAVVVGADAIFDNYFINKTGTLSLALLSKYFNIPFYTVGCVCKYLDVEAQKFYKINKKPENEISDINCERINRYFEEIPFEFVNKMFVR